MNAARFSLRHRAKSRSIRSDIGPFLARIRATETMSLSALANGFILGWPPEPINGEMIRRGLLPKERGGGFWGAWPIGLGACTGDFLWAFCVSLGAGALLGSIAIWRGLAILSRAFLCFLAAKFALSAWRIYRTHRLIGLDTMPKQAEKHGGFFVGLLIVL